MSFFFYNHDGKRVAFDKEEFVRVYGQSYYLHNNDCKLYIPKISVNSYYAEEQVESILTNGICNENDVDLILAWKIGGINHIKTESDETIVYKKDWQNNGIVKERYFKCERNEFNTFCNRIKEIALDSCNQTDVEIINEITNAASKNHVKLGPVYILTLLYFITKGRSPIFDRYAYVAAKSICIGVAPQMTWYEYPTNKAPEAILSVINEYKWFLTQVFGHSNISRSIDRALWVYGHMFFKEKECKI